MRVYYKTTDEEIFSEDYAQQLTQPINDIARRVLILMLEKMKYEIMWALRSLEEEVNNSEGIIIIECKSMNDKCKIYAKGFDDELAAKIREIGLKTKL